MAPAPDPADVDSNPLGECRCDGELWVSEGCSYAFYCNSSLPIGGEYTSCPKDVSDGFKLSSFQDLALVLFCF